MRRNYSKLIRNKEKRELSAAGYKFFYRCFQLACEQRKLTVYHKKTKPLKDKLKKLMEHLIIDREMSKEEIKELVQNKKIEI